MKTSSANPIVANAIKSNRVISNTFNVGQMKSDLTRLTSLLSTARGLYDKVRKLRSRSLHKLPINDEDLVRLEKTVQTVRTKLPNVVMNGKRLVSEYDQVKKEYMKVGKEIKTLCDKIQNDAEDNLDWSKNRDFLNSTGDLGDYGWSLVQGFSSFDLTSKQYRDMMNEPDYD